MQIGPRMINGDLHTRSSLSLQRSPEEMKRPTVRVTIILPHPVGTPGGKPQRLTASAKKEREHERPYFPPPRFAGGAPQHPVSSKSEEKHRNSGCAWAGATVVVPAALPSSMWRDRNTGRRPESLPSLCGATAYCGRIGLYRATPHGVCHSSGTACCLRPRESQQWHVCRWQECGTRNDQTSVGAHAARPACALEIWASPGESPACRSRE